MYIIKDTKDNTYYYGEAMCSSCDTMGTEVWSELFPQSGDSKHHAKAYPTKEDAQEIINNHLAYYASGCTVIANN